jgi:formamidopyrimidine-DNA glycosylase
MPELPEVTTMVKGLNKTILNQTINDVWTDTEKLIKNMSFLKFKKKLIGQKVISVERKGKIVVIHLSNDLVLYIHPKMTGHPLIGKWKLIDGHWKAMQKGDLEDPMNRFIHVIFFLDKKMFAFSDLRKFGRIELWEEKDNPSIVSKLGIDALDIQLKDFKEILKTTRKIKQVLMDQEKVAGIGNIYADEILFKSRIHPFRKSNSLTEPEIKRIFNAIKPILKLSVDKGGSSVSDFRGIDGSKGSFQTLTKVYNHEGEKCYRCKGTVHRIKMGSRSCYYCPECQKLTE